jgi:asparagine synthase (glutamine-hydrolysing)
MCGFVAVFDPTSVNKERLSCQVDALYKRGPDDKGLWISPDYTVGLGSRRLSINDLSNRGHMPMVSADRKASITFNGEIYNFRLLREELIGKGYQFISNTDTEVVLNGYLEWGSEIVTKLRGMFGFVIFDSRFSNKKFFIARDIVGEKPVFITEQNGGVIIASELSAILSDERVSRNIDPVALDSLLALGYVPGELSLVSGIRKLLPAHAGFFDLKTLVWDIKSYWHLPKRVHSSNSIEESSVEFYSLLKQSVESQLQADVPVGIFLSGGIDSSLVLAAAAESGARKIKTFNVSFPGGGVFDESVYAKTVAEHFGTEHHTLDFNSEIINEFDFVSENLDEPIGDSSIVPTSLVSRFARQNVKVALGGDGGDELFGGYGSYQMSDDKYIKMFSPSVLKIVSQVAKRMPVGLPGRNRISSLSGDARARFVSRGIVFNEVDRYRILSNEIRDISLLNYAQKWRESLTSDNIFSADAAMRMDFLSYLPCDILTKVDRASMMNSLEVRSPFLTKEIVDFAFSNVPLEYKVGIGFNKKLLKHTASKVLPKNLNLERKQGFSIPHALWNSKRWHSIIEDEIASLPRSWFNFRELKNLMEISSKQSKVASYFFVLVLLSRWRRRFNIN